MDQKMVKSPAHYTEGRKFEPKDVIRDWGLDFNLGSTVKYIARAGRKDDILQDLKKAQEYIQFEIDAIEAERISKVHLCKSCKKEFPTCDGCPTFGNGLGMDNVCECSGYINWETNVGKYDLYTTKDKPNAKKQAVPKHPNCKCSVHPVFAEMENGKGVSCGVIELEVPAGTPPEDIIKMVIEKVYKGEC